MQQGIMELMWRSSHVSGSNVHYVEALYEQYLDDPSAVPDEWRQYFDQLPRPDAPPTMFPWPRSANSSTSSPSSADRHWLPPQPMARRAASRSRSSS